MVLDRDYPMTPTQLKVLAIGYALVIAFGVVLFGGFIPGIKPNFSAPVYATVDGHEYFVESSPLPLPGFSHWSAPWNVTFHNVTFGLQIENWNASVGRLVYGNGTEPNGTHYAFELGEMEPNGSLVRWFLSPDADFAASWNGGWFSQLVILLYVLVPPATAGP